MKRESLQNDKIMNNKGGLPMLVFIIAIIMFLLTGAMYAGIMEPIFAAFSGFDTMDRACNQFCDIQTDVEGYSSWQVANPFDRISISERALDGLKSNIDPKAMGCYCGVSERSGKYIHMHGHDDGRLEEFHITEQNPKIHLDYVVGDDDATGDFDHSGDVEECEEWLDDEFTGLADLENYEGCIIFSIHDTDEQCTIRGYEEGSVLLNKEGSKLANPVIGSSESLGTSVRGNPLQLEIGQEVTVEGDRPNYQRILMQRYWKGTHPLELYAPVVCKSENVEQDPKTEFDEACAEYCGDKEMGFWASRCSDTALRDYDELPEEYRNGEEFCPEDLERPYCQCVVEKEYYWQVDEDYEPDVE